MGIRQYKPTTPGRRGGSVSDFAEITDRKKKPEKSLLQPHPKKGGRNFQGIVCTRFRGGGHKRMYRIIDFKRRKDDVWAHGGSRSSTIRTARAASPCCSTRTATRAYILAPEGLKAGDKVMSGDERRAARRQLHAAAEDSAGHERPQRGDAAGPRRPDLPQRRHHCDADRPRRRMGPDHAAVGRSAPHQRRVPGDHRRRSATPTT